MNDSPSGARRHTQSCKHWQTRQAGVLRRGTLLSRARTRRRTLTEHVEERRRNAKKSGVGLCSGPVEAG